MNDRELLELAAKAAGMGFLIWTPGSAPFVPEEHRASHGSIAWHPLSDDGDALRLAIEIGIFDGPTSFAKFYPWLSDALVVIDDYASAFKRAITCYAAEIGRTMP